MARNALFLLLLLIYLFISPKRRVCIFKVFLRDSDYIQRRHRQHYRLHCKNLFSIFLESGLWDQMETGEHDLPAAPGSPPASARLTSPVVVAAASLSGMASPPWRRPREIVAVLEAPSWPAATWGRIGCVGGVGKVAAPPPWSVLFSPRGGSVLRRFASHSFLAGWCAVGGRHLLYEVQGHLWVNVWLWVDRTRPACAQYVLWPLPPASRAADQLNSVKDSSRGQFPPEQEFQLGEAWEDWAPELLTWPAASQQGPMIYRVIGVTMKIWYSLSSITSLLSRHRVSCSAHSGATTSAPLTW